MLKKRDDRWTFQQSLNQLLERVCEYNSAGDPSVQVIFASWHLIQVFIEFLVRDASKVLLCSVETEEISQLFRKASVSDWVG